MIQGFARAATINLDWSYGDNQTMADKVANTLSVLPNCVVQVDADETGFNLDVGTNDGFYDFRYNRPITS